MFIIVRYYAMLRDVTDQNVEEMEVPQNCNGSGLIEAIIDRYPEVAEFAPYLRLATDTEYISRDAILTEGSEISIIPPVSGG